VTPEVTPEPEPEVPDLPIPDIFGGDGANESDNIFSGGLDLPDLMTGSNDSNGSGASTSSCRGKRTVSFTLPRSYRGVKSVRVTAGSRVRIVRLSSNRKLRVSLTRRHGDTRVTVRKKGHPTVKRIYVLCADK